jgi:hypothetical protein
MNVTSVTFTENAVAAGPTSMSLVIVSGSNQRGVRSTALAQPIVVQVLGSDGKPAAGVPVEFTVASGDATVAQPTVTTDQNGLASTSVMLGSTTGPVSIVASADDGALTQTFDETNGLLSG